MSTNLKSLYAELLARCKNVYVMQSTMNVVYWDMQTKMPPSGVSLRGQQTSLLQVLQYKMVTDPRMGELVSTIMVDPSYTRMGASEKRNVHLVKKNYEENVKIPESLVADLARQRATAITTWKKAKEKKNFDLFKPELEKNIELIRKKAEILQKVEGTKTPYDALLDSYEPKMYTRETTELFDELKAGLVALLSKVKKSGFTPDFSLLTAPVPVEKQWKIAEFALDFIDVDIKSPNAWARLDTTEHPFTSGFYDDVRVTTKFTENWWPRSLFTVMHEGGHAVYDRHYPRQYMFQPIGDRCSHGIHESQSRFLENMVGRSPEFLAYALPILKKMVGKPFRGVKTRDFISAVNRVQPTVLRGQADEITYSLHIIIRFELERDIFAGKVSVDDLPSAWNNKYKDYLGVTVKDDGEGVMQDTHWAGNSFGYFPSYAIGNVYDGMFVKKLRHDVPDYRKSLRKGDCKPVIKWLGDNVQSRGNMLDPPDLMKEVCGTKVTVKPFLSYLERKFGKIYGF